MSRHGSVVAAQAFRRYNQPFTHKVPKFGLKLVRRPLTHRSAAPFRIERITFVPELKVGVQLAALRLPFRKALLAANRLGASAVEIDARGEIRPDELGDTGLRDLRRLLEDANLRVAAIAFPTRRGYDVADDIDRRVAATKAAMKLAAQLGAQAVVNRIGPIPAEQTGPQWDLLVQALTDLSRYGHHVGARLAAQTGAESGADLARILAALPPQGIGVDLDPGYLEMAGLSPLDTIHDVGAHILHVHARDGVRDSARGRGLEVPLGRGSVDFPALLGALEEQQYRGYFTIARQDAEDPERELAAAVQYLKSL